MARLAGWKLDVSSVEVAGADVLRGLVERVRASPWLRRVLAVLMLLFIVGCSVAVYLLPLGSTELAPLGYLAVFLSTLVAGMAILVPGVNVVVLVAGRSMDPFLVALIGGLGSALGESTGYAGGRATRSLVTERRMDSRWAKTIAALVRRNAFLTILGPGVHLGGAGRRGGPGRRPRRLLVPQVLPGHVPGQDAPLPAGRPAGRPRLPPA